MSRSKHASAEPPPRVRAGERGYNLVILTVMIAVMTIALGAALPRWTAQAEREREEELIFRGLQYAEAIRIFQTRTGRLPVRLEELIEVEPRSIRQLWPNPMREDGRWALIFQTAPGQQNVGRPRNPRNARARQVPSGVPGTGDPNHPDAGVVLSGADGDGFGEVATGPIRGVYHPGDEEAFKTFFDSNTVSEWKFTFDLLQGGPQQPPGTQQRGSPPGTDTRGGGQAQQQQPLNASLIGRPFPPGIQPPNLGRPGSGQQAPGRPVGTPPDAAGGPGGAAVEGLRDSTDGEGP